MPHLKILLHLVPLLSPSVLLICFLSISIFLTLLPAPSYSFGIRPSFRLSRHSLSPQIYFCVHIKSLFTLILSRPPSHLFLLLKLPVDRHLTCRIFKMFSHCLNWKGHLRRKSIHCQPFLNYSALPRVRTALFICLPVSHLQYLRHHLPDLDSFREMMHCTLKFQSSQGRQP